MYKFSERVDIRLGYQCNARCRFCYYQHSVKETGEDPSTYEVMRILKMLRKEGATEIEFTGGEPTLREDLVELVYYAKSLGFTNVSILTNGLRLEDPGYSKRLIDAGVNDFLFSIHGHTEQLHDSQTQVRGSFRKILKSIENIKSHSVRCRSSTTISGLNYQNVAEIIEILIKFDMNCIQLSIFCPTIQATEANKKVFAKYSDMMEFVKKAIDQNKDILPPLSVKYVPFCFMKGYENYVMNLYQQSFDPDDWNLYLSHKARLFQKGIPRTVSSSLSLFSAILLKRYMHPSTYGLYGFKIFGSARLVQLLHKKRTNVCNKCAYDYVCDYVFKNYLVKFGDSEIVPILGPKIMNPVWCYDLARSRMPGTQLV